MVFVSVSQMLLAEPARTMRMERPKEQNRQISMSVQKCFCDFHQAEAPPPLGKFGTVEESQKPLLVSESYMHLCVKSSTYSPVFASPKQITLCRLAKHETRGFNRVFDSLDGNLCG